MENKTGVLIKKRKWKNGLSIAAASAVIIIAAVSVENYVKARHNALQESGDASGRNKNMGGNFNEESGAVMAAGTTFAGVKAVTFEIDFLKEASLYVEKVFLANGDSVKAGDKCIKFTAASIADVRNELESAKLDAQSAYRSGKVSDGENRIKAKYAYDMALLEAKSARQVYDDAIAQLNAGYAQAAKAYEQAQQEYNEYLERAQNNSFYEYYGIDSLKKAYEDAKELYISQKEHYEVTDEEMNEEGRDMRNDREWVIKMINLLAREMQDAKEKYAAALEEYEDEIAQARLKLQKLYNVLETAREDFADAEILYKKNSLSAKTVYEISVAKGKTAKADYNTQLARLKDSLERLQDKKDEAEGRLALFEELAGDGYLYAKESGTVRMLAAEEGKALAGGSMIFACSNPEQILVSVPVGQENIAKLHVGEAASVEIPGRGNYSGVIETINPISSSNGRGFVSYTVTVSLQGDLKGLGSNLTANVAFEEAKGEKSARNARQREYSEQAAQQENLKTGVTENGTVEFGITSQIYEPDIFADDGSNEGEEGAGYLRIEEVYAAVGQRIQEGDKVYSFTRDSIDSVRKALAYDKTKAELALSAAQTEYEIGVLEAELSRNEALLDAALAQASYDTKAARLSNDMAAKSLETEQLLNDIYKLQCDLTDKDYLEEKSDIAAAYEKAVKSVFDAAGDFVTNKVDAARAFNDAKTSYERFFSRLAESEQQIQDKVDKVYEIQEEIAYSRQLLENELLAARQQLDMSAVSGEIADAKYESSLESCANALSKAQREFDEASKKLDAFDEFAGEGTIYAKGSGIVTEVGYKAGDCLTDKGTLIAFAKPEDISVSVDVPQEDIVKMKAGDAAEIKMTAYEGEIYEGKIESVATTATSKSSAAVSYKVSVSIQGDTSKLYGGMTADVIFAAKEAENKDEQ